MSEGLMRALVDIPEKQIDQLAVICEVKKLSRAEAIRQAIGLYIEQNKSGTTDAFGLWKDRKIDGLAYQEQVRSEW
jgi:metal-responsive CopG/Arc/MetJ family transcriptional regulator